MTINVFKDIADALSSAADAVSSFTDAIKHLVKTGNEGYEYITAQRDYSRLKDLSVRLEILRSFSNARVVESIDEYLKKESPTSLDWNAVLDGVTNALTEVHSILDDVKNERSDVVLEESFSKLTHSISARLNLLNKLKSLNPPETSDEINELIIINVNYKKLISHLKLVVKELNSYLASCNNIKTSS